MKYELDFILTKHKLDFPRFNMTRCMECRWRGNVDHCTQGFESDATYPDGEPYRVFSCPRCAGEVVFDVGVNEWKRFNKEKAKELRGK
jgi:hypothetical protein